MRYLFLIFISISIFAQENSLISEQSGSGANKHTEITVEKKHLFESLLEIKNKREWIKSINELNSDDAILLSTLIKFKEKEPNFIDTDLFLIMAGSAIVLGATAAYFKLESDSIYDEYLETNDKSLLQKTDRYDLYSGLALGALQINFGYMIYKFLTD